MNYGEFLHEFDDLIEVYGADAFPKPVLERAYLKVKDLNAAQLKEVCNMLIDTCKFAPKVPDIIDQANIVRARHREGVRQAYPTDDGPRTPEIGRQALATITSILSQPKRGSR